MTTTPPNIPRALSSEDGQDWQQSGSSRESQWRTSPDHSVVKLVLGRLGKAEANDNWDDVLPVLASGLKDHFPNLTHLHLWSLPMEKLGPLPDGLKVLDVRKSDGLDELPSLPQGLEELVLWTCPALSLEDGRGDFSFPKLFDLSLRDLGRVSQAWLDRLLERAAALRFLEIEGSEELSAFTRWPSKLEVIKVNQCPNLLSLPGSWPEKLRRLEFRGALRLADLGAGSLPATMDFLDLRGTAALKNLPPRRSHPRTLFIFGSGLELPNELFGENEEFNAARGVWAFLDSARGTDHEVKVILLGNGRAGKSSLARRWVEGGFDPQERSTHGIRLWHHETAFEPVDESGTESRVRLNIWDFAGQDLYHNAHRMFLQSKAVFVLCDTVAGDGSDPATDGTDCDGLPPGWDIDRTLHYWRGQVAALGSPPGLDGPPPMLVVRTKCDRDDEAGMSEKLADFQGRNGTATAGLEAVEFSAKTGAGIEEIVAWVSRQTARVLGPRGKRELTEGTLSLKAELRKRMEKNDEAHRDAESSGEPAKPPFPVMHIDEMKERISFHCRDEAYRDQPDLLLNFLHLGGFLFHKPEHLPEEVILDQRWATQGIYAAFDRETSWPLLVARKGRFFPADLGKWAWKRNGYSPEEQSLFLRFMDSCGMIYPLGERGGRTEYVVPRALPLYDSSLEREAADYRGDLHSGRSLVLHHESLSRDSMMELICNLGREWGHAPVLWLWGGQFESYRRWRNLDETVAPTFVHLNWIPETPDSYGGKLTLTQFGPDESFLAAVLNECRKLGGFREVNVPVIDFPAEVDSGWNEQRLPDLSREDRGDVASHQRPTGHAALVEVGISFAGDQKGVPTSLEELPASSIERWPLALAAFLRREYGFKVEEYRSEQCRDPHAQQQGRKGYLDTLVNKDFMFIFVSGDYLRSPWCMYEFLKVFEKCSDSQKQRPDMVRVGRFNDALWSQTDMGNSDPLKEFADYWWQWYGTFKSKLDDRVRSALARTPNINAHERELNSWAYADWARCVAEDSKFEEIKGALNGDGWNFFAIQSEPSKEEIKAWAQALCRNTERQAYLFDRSESAWADGQHEKAQRLFIHAFLGEDPDGQPEGLQRALEKPLGADRQSVLNQIRRSVLEEFNLLSTKGEITTWQQLAAAVAPEQKNGAGSASS